MKKISTAFLFCAVIAVSCLLAGCGGSPHDTAYDSTYYNVSMNEALQASQAFVNQSVKSKFSTKSIKSSSDTASF